MKFKHIAPFMVLVLAACEKQLDLSPVTNLTNVTYYKTADDAKAALGACYSQIGGTDPFLDLATSDDGVPFLTGSADRPLLWRYNITPSNTFISNYAGAYSGINRSNIVLGRLPGISMDESLKKRYIAEAKFLRALHYFNLVRLYGDVPIVTTETTSLDGLAVSRDPADKVYELIEADLKEAESVLPKTYPASESGRATQGAAKGMLARVYLTRAGTTAGSPYWAQAAAKAKEVMDLGVYDLYANFADAFAISARGGKENIFEIQNLTDVKGHTLGRGYGVRSAPIYPGTGSGIARPSPSLFNLYSDKDTRKAVTFLTSYVYNGVTTTLSSTDPDFTKAIAFQKLWDKPAKTLEGTSIPILRYSDVLLMYAEATNEASNGPTTDAYAALNKVRTRAGLTALSGLPYAQFKEAVWLERRLELTFENSRRFDLIRTGRLLDAVKAENSFARNATIQPFHVLMPIPQTDMDANPNLKQNPGY
ncbi:RagB/SusD family nutrient uptake outer membrane protein [Spirosoma endbachense]|uniref:RagB/SusD family nutrient uptake outer membrane protein n=1 Tax=Spirosoma endbachense TaxID=2666025 RepID=A0A6P1VQP2_9BACT|nr:RagB/SusD family nutrient uptake outer membrane protein [Spirosoma endbachense]QHV93909.1 RagB/SusD family nutrient uptake outer membrane protein [Spirosoma endbachense]